MNATQKCLAVTIFVLLCVSFVFAGAKETFDEAMFSFGKGDFKAAWAFGISTFLIAAEQLQLLKWGSIVLGLVLISLIALRASRFLNNPLPKKVVPIVDGSDGKIADMFRKNETSLDSLKKKLWEK